MKIETFFDPNTFTLTYIVFDPSTKDAIVIDPVLDYDQASSTYRFESVEKVLNFVKKNELSLHYIFETHAHADHLSGARELKHRFPSAKVAITSQIKAVQKTFGELFNLDWLAKDGSQFDELLEDGQEIAAGSLQLKVISTPGHTPACASFYVNGEAVFVGDTIFMPDFGTGRCDFPQGSATDLYHSVHEKLYALPSSTRVFVGHDYQPGGRELQFETTIEEQKKNNIQLKAETTEEKFVRFRTERDAKLLAPRLLLPSIQFNINAGEMPPAEDNGTSYIKLPLRKG